MPPAHPSSPTVVLATQGSFSPTPQGRHPPTWHGHAGDGLGLAQRVHLDVLEALAGGTLQVPAPGWERVGDSLP